MNLRLTQTLTGKIKVTGLSSLPLGDDPLTDWPAHFFTAARTQ